MAQEFKDYSYALIQFSMMKKMFFAFATAFALLLSCTPENKNENGENESDDLAITGDVLKVLYDSATLTGYANLPIELGNAEVGVMYDVNRAFESAKKVLATELDGNNMFTVAVTGLEQNTTYYYKTYVQNGMATKYGAVKSFTTQASNCPPGAVDLGIVMTRKDGTTYELFWAESNLDDSGLCSQSSYSGGYYAWGELKPKSSYDWEHYEMRTSKYNNVDKKTVLAPEDDVAHVKLGGKWRLPTDEEWKELMTKCTWVGYSYNGVSGQMGTAPNGKTIFLPLAGYRRNSDLYVEGSVGYYWSSSLNTEDPQYAWNIAFYLAPVKSEKNSFKREYGCSIRPVSE